MRVDRLRVEMRAAATIIRLIRAYHAKTLVARAKAQLAREETILRGAVRRLIHGKLLRMFEAWGEYALKMHRVRRFVKKHIAAGERKAFHAWEAYMEMQRQQRTENAARSIQGMVCAHYARNVLDRARAQRKREEETYWISLNFWPGIAVS